MRAAAGCALPCTRSSNSSSKSSRSPVRQRARPRPVAGRESRRPARECASARHGIGASAAAAGDGSISGELVAEIQQPAADERQRRDSAAGIRSALPPSLQRLEKAAARRVRAPTSRRRGAAAGTRRWRWAGCRTAPPLPAGAVPAPLSRSPDSAPETSRRESAAQMRRKMSEPLVPPNPNELDRAYSSGICRAVFGT